MARGKRRKKYEHRKAPIPKGIPRGLRLLLEGNHSYLCIEKELVKCCDAHPKCKYTEECRRRYDTRCNKWYVDKESKASPTKKQSPSIVVVIPSTPSPGELIEAIESQLLKAV